MLATLDGMETDFNSAHSANALFGIEIDISDEQRLNTKSAILVTPGEIITDTNSKHSKNALAAICVTFEGMITCE